MGRFQVDLGHLKKLLATEEWNGQRRGPSPTRPWHRSMASLLWRLCLFPHVSGCIFPINVSKCIEVYRSVSYMYRDFRYTPLDTVSRHFLFDTRSIQARYVLGAVGISILYRVVVLITLLIPVIVIARI